MLDKAEPGIGSLSESNSDDNLNKVVRTEPGQIKPADARSPYMPGELPRDSSDDLSQPNAEDWANQSSDTITRYYAQAESDFFRIVNDYLEQANLAAQRYKEFSASHNRWRFWAIMGTGGLAVINVCAAFQFFDVVVWGATKLPTLLNAIAALFAGGLTVAGNVENFFNKGEKAAGFRESRDLLLSRYREYCFKWFFYVEAYGKTGNACMNAGRLYRQLVDSDNELRQKLKQLTEVQGRGAGEAGGKAGG